MSESVSRLKPQTKFSKLSIQRRPMEWESGWLSAVRSLRDIAAVSGPSQILGQVLPSCFLFLVLLAIQVALKPQLHLEELWSRCAERQVLCLYPTSSSYRQYTKSPARRPELCRSLVA